MDALGRNRPVLGNPSDPLRVPSAQEFRRCASQTGANTFHKNNRQICGRQTIESDDSVLVAKWGRNKNGVNSMGGGFLDDYKRKILLFRWVNVTP